MSLRVVGKVGGMGKRRTDDADVKPAAQEHAGDERQRDNRHEEEVQAWKDKYMRALADYQNLEKRSREERLRIQSYAAESLLQRILPVVDTFERAQTHLKDPGLALAMKEFHAALSEQGVEKMDVLGKPFNPHEMDCVEVVTGKKDTVTDVLESGYRLHDKVLRVAKVKVGNGT